MCPRSNAPNSFTLRLTALTPLLEPRHLDPVGNDDATSVGGDEDGARAGLARAVDAVRPPAGYPGEVGLRREQKAAEPTHLAEARNAVELLIEFGHQLLVYEVRESISVFPAEDLARSN